MPLRWIIVIALVVGVGLLGYLLEAPSKKERAKNRRMAYYETLTKFSFMVIKDGKLWRASNDESEMRDEFMNARESGHYELVQNSWGGISETYPASLLAERDVR